MLSISFPHTLDRLSREMDRFFEGATPASEAAPPASAQIGRWPGVNLWRDADRIVAEAEVPGFRMEDLEVLATEDTLTIRGRRQATRPEGAAALRIERSVASFERSFRLPVEIDGDRAAASLQNGVLRVSLPVAERALPTRIEVTALGADEPARELPQSGQQPAEESGAPSCPVA